MLKFPNIGPASMGILEALDRRPHDGPELANKEHLARGSVYVLLGRLRQDGLVDCEDVENPAQRRPRKYYRLTTRGERTLRAVRLATLAMEGKV
jgi:DNA-binding PadR family transcriptional regulator